MLTGAILLVMLSTTTQTAAQTLIFLHLTTYPSIRGRN